MNGEESAAVLSECGRYRYALRRQWQQSPMYVLWIMLNPSTADAKTNDATIRRCMRYSREWGFGGMLVGNLYGMRATYPGDLIEAPDPVGPENDAHLLKMSLVARTIVCAWGQPGPIPARRWQVLRLLGCPKLAPPLHYLTLNRNGEPGHPLRLSATLKPTPWVPFVDSGHGAGA